MWLTVISQSEGTLSLPPRRGRLFRTPWRDLRAPSREHHHCWRQTLPFRGNVALAKFRGEEADGFGSIHDEIKIVVRSRICHRLRLSFFSPLFSPSTQGQLPACSKIFTCVASEIVFHPSYSHIIRTDCCPFTPLPQKKRRVHSDKSGRESRVT